MSDADRRASRLRDRLEVLAEIGALADGRVPPEVAVRVGATSKRAEGRLGHGAARTVVALAGATGSGKSSLFNALAGRPLAATGVRRPTTATTQAAVFTSGTTVSADAAALLDWLEVRQHSVVDDSALDGLVLLDLPDHDSTQAEHRQEVDRLVRVVDLFVWVVDPQKYADAALHRDYLQRFAGHAAVTVVALNHIDTLAPADRTAALDDLARLLALDGLPVARPGVVAKLTGADGGVRVMGVSALTGEGVDALRREVAARVSARRALIDRLDADLDWIADDLSAALGEAPRTTLPARVEAELGEALAGAAGADAVADAVAHAHRRRGVHAAGWPPTRWISRLRPDPLRRLGLDRARRAGRREHDRPEDGVVDRTSLPPPSPVAAAAVSSALRQVGDEAARGLPELWRARLVAVAGARRDDLADALDRAVAGARLPTRTPRWWRGAGAVQIAVTAAMVVGLVWLAAIFLVAWWNLPDLPTAEIGELPVPAVLAIGGAAAGWIVAALARRSTAVGARRRAAVARRRIVAAARTVGRELVLAPVEEELARLARLHALVGRLRG